MNIEQQTSETTTIISFTYIGCTTFVKMADASDTMYIKIIIKNYSRLKWKVCNYDVWICKILYSIKVTVMTIWLRRYRTIFFCHSEKPYPKLWTTSGSTAVTVFFLWKPVSCFINKLWTTSESTAVVEASFVFYK